MSQKELQENNTSLEQAAAILAQIFVDLVDSKYGTKDKESSK